jgi:serine/threonine protein kinase
VRSSGECSFEVLFVKKDNVWKIADFGLALEGTSRGVNTTRYARGTNGYRAPELIKDDSTFNNKVDIWALGCITYELATRRKAFDSDWNIMAFVSGGGLSSRPELEPTSLDDRSKFYLQEIINSMLAIELWKRPSASDLLKAMAFLNELLGIDAIDQSSNTNLPWMRCTTEWEQNKLRAYWYRPLS